MTVKIALIIFLCSGAHGTSHQSTNDNIGYVVQLSRSMRKIILIGISQILPVTQKPDQRF